MTMHALLFDAASHADCRQQMKAFARRFAGQPFAAA